MNAPPPAPVSNASQHVQRSPSLIYVVDDEPMVIELVQTILKPLGCRIESFRDGTFALETFRDAERKPDLIVTDYSMTSLNGLELMDQCRGIRPGQKVILMSGTVSEEIFEGRADVPDLFIAKPFEISAFAVAVGRLLS